MFSAAIFIVVNLAAIQSSMGQMGESLPSVDEILQTASDFPGLNTSALPIEEGKIAFKKKCEENGGAEAFSQATNAAKEIESCVRSLVNVTALHDEIEQAKPTGDLDTVFKKYCNKSPILKACVKNFTNAMEPCFTQKERENIRIIQNITDSLLNFVCFKEGDRIALFIAAGGPECFTSKQSAIQDCVNSTFGNYIPAEGLTTSPANGLTNIPLLLLEEKECTDIEKLQSCIVKDLETCNDPAPGNIVDSLFNFIKRVTPCDNLLSKIRAAASVSEPVSNGSSSNIAATFTFLILGLLSIIKLV